MTKINTESKKVILKEINETIKISKFLVEKFIETDNFDFIEIAYEYMFNKEVTYINFGLSWNDEIIRKLNLLSSLISNIYYFEDDTMGNLDIGYRCTYYIGQADIILNG